MKTLASLTPVIFTDRLKLRPPVQTDLEEYRRVAGDPEVPLGAAGWLVVATDGAHRTFVVERREVPGLIGAIRLTDMMGKTNPETCLWIGFPYQRRGYAAEALRGVLRCGFEDAARPVAGVKSGNVIDGGFRWQGGEHDRVSHCLFADEGKALPRQQQRPA